jgi:hypothetical protein
MTILGRLTALDARGWSAATWSAPLLTNLILASVVGLSWALGKLAPGPSALLFLVSALAALVVCALSTALLLRSADSRAQGIAISIVGSYAVAVVGGAIFGFWVLGW